MQETIQVVVAHAGIMEETKAMYPFKHTEVRAYNDNKGNTEVTIENPYESKIPTQFMVDADSYITLLMENSSNHSWNFTPFCEKPARMWTLA